MQADQQQLHPSRLIHLWRLRLFSSHVSGAPPIKRNRRCAFRRSLQKPQPLSFRLHAGGISRIRCLFSALKGFSSDEPATDLCADSSTIGVTLSQTFLMNVKRRHNSRSHSWHVRVDVCGCLCGCLCSCLCGCLCAHLIWQVCLCLCVCKSVHECCVGQVETGL